MHLSQLFAFVLLLFGVQKAFPQYWLDSGESISLYTGEYATLLLKAPMTGAIIDSYTFSNTSGYVEIHGDNAIVNGYFSGTTTITCTYAYHYYIGTTKYNSTNNKAYYYISAKPINIKLNKSNLSLAPNEEEQLSYAVLQSDAPSPEIKWVSSDETVASVTNGLVLAKKAGSAVITAKNNAGSDVTCNVTVKRIDPISIELPKNATVEANKSITLKPMLQPKDAQADFSWSSSDNSVATVNNGEVTGIKAGKAVIELKTHNGLTATCDVEVLPAKITLSCSIESGIIETNAEVSVSASIPYAKIYYTLDGTIPTQESFLYTEPIKIPYSLILSAKAFLDGYTESEILTREYTATCLTTTNFSPGNGQNTIDKLIIPAVTFNNSIIEDENFRKISIRHGQTSISMEPIVAGSVLYIVPTNELEEGVYTVSVPAKSISYADNPNKEFSWSFNYKKIEPMVAAGSHFSLALKEDGSLWAWGNNNLGQIGNGEAGTDCPTPVKVLDNVIAATGGLAHTLALKSDGSLWAWGDNSEGQLGNGTTDNCYIPQKILDDVVYIEAHNDVSMAIKKDGSLWAWGYGYLGNGSSYVTKKEPTKILSNIKSVSYNSHALAVANNGVLYVWGSNWSNELGSSISSDYLKSPKVFGSGYKNVAAGSYHNLAIKNDGYVYAWGSNSYGQSGGTNKNIGTPTKIAALGNSAKIAAGYQHSMALREDGGLYTWGRNDYGQLGTGSEGSYRSSPVKILNNIISIAAGVGHNVALSSDGNVYAWGWNSDYQIGNGETSNVISPTIVFNTKTPITNLSLTETVNVNVTEKAIAFTQMEPTTAEYETMEWSCSDESIATVSPRGIVTGIAPGETTLTLKVISKDGIEFTADCKVTVTERFFKGDVNGDGDVDTRDAIAILKYVVGITPEGFNAAADYNNDGDVDTRDAIAILKKVVE